MRTVKSERGKVSLVLATLVLLLVLVFGPAAPSVVAQADAWDGMHGLLADPVVGGGSGG